MGKDKFEYLEGEIEKMINEGGIGVASHYDYPTNEAKTSEK